MCRSKIFRDERGGALLESSLLMPVLLLVTLGIVYFGLEYWAALALSQATYTAARCRAVDTTKCASDTAARTFAQSGAWGLNSSNINFQMVSCSNGVTQSSGPTLPSTVTMYGTDQTRIKILNYLNLSPQLQAKVCFYKQS